ncbi:hypothetical protein B0T18DRAFT_386637 [Schizothecium vesticola]|uniref:Uncharacterized protein n=1 Tax=Schizothecium vesticola TaxID=314040 RepID=A0AA40FBP1_9PEZI|nr:hypothetical protein B0T18DRAFT_386637 [Schizothecium vesticola]
MGFGDSVKSLLETYSNCVSLLKSLRPPKPKGRDDSAKKDDQQVVLLKSLKKDRALVERAYSSRLSETGGKLRKGDARAMSALDRILKRIRVTVTKLLRISSKEQNPMLDYESLMTLSNSSRIDAIRTIDNLSRRLGSNNSSRVTTTTTTSSKSRASPPPNPSPPSPPPARRKSRSSHISSHDGTSHTPSPTKPVPSPTKPVPSPTKPVLSPTKPIPSPTKPAPSPTKPAKSQSATDEPKPPRKRRSSTRVKEEKAKLPPGKPKPATNLKPTPSVLSKSPRTGAKRLPAVPDAPPPPPVPDAPPPPPVPVSLRAPSVSVSPEPPKTEGKKATVEFDTPPSPLSNDNEAIPQARPVGVAQRLAAAAQNRVSIASFATDSTKLGEIPERRLRSHYIAAGGGAGGAGGEGRYNTRPLYPLKPYKVEVKERGFWGGLFGRKKEQ